MNDRFEHSLTIKFLLILREFLPAGLDVQLALYPFVYGLLDEVEVLLSDEVEFFENGRDGKLAGDVFIQVLFELFLSDGLVIESK